MYINPIAGHVCITIGIMTSILLEAPEATRHFTTRGTTKSKIDSGFFNPDFVILNQSSLFFLKANRMISF